MAYEQRDNSGSLFPNDKREKDTHPNLRGSIMVGGVMYWIDAWTKHKADGTKWLSLAVKPKKSRSEAPSRQAAKPKADDFDESADIPF